MLEINSVLSLGTIPAILADGAAASSTSSSPASDGSGEALAALVATADGAAPASGGVAVSGGIAASPRGTTTTVDASVGS